MSILDFFRQTARPVTVCPTCGGTGEYVAVPKPEPQPSQCYVQGCSEPATWHDLVLVTFPSHDDGSVMQMRVKLGLNTCDLHCWELDQAMKARAARFAVSTAQRRPYKPRSKS